MTCFGSLVLHITCITQACISVNQIEYDVNVNETYVYHLKISPGTSTRNPYESKTSYTTLAPSMGEDVRKEDTLPKTEVKEGMKKRKEDSKVPAKKLDEDSIVSLLDLKKVCYIENVSSYCRHLYCLKIFIQKIYWPKHPQPQKRDLQEACHALGVSDEGSITDLENRLEELINFKELYPKLFLKLQKTGGQTSK